MPIFRPSAIGGTVSASDSDAISDELNIVDPTFGSLIVGAKIWNIDVGAFFVLTASSASLVTDQILAVLGFNGLRWIKEFVTNQFRFGANLTDASVTIAPGSGKFSAVTLPPDTLTADRNLTLGTAGAAAGDVFQVICQDLGSHNYHIKNGAGTDLVVTNGATRGQAQVFQFFFTSGDWAFNIAWWVE